MLRWHSDVFSSNEEGEKIFFDIREKLKSIPHPYCGWRSIPNQNLDTIYINKYGLRSPDFDISTNKKDICFLVGGSVAWGYGATNNEFIPSYQIQKYLKKNGFDFEVINFAQNSHNSHDELRSFLSTVDELKPKLVISISGINDGWQVAKRGFNKTQQMHNIVVNFFNWGQALGIVFEKHNSFRKLIKIMLRYFFKATYFPNHEFYQFTKHSDPCYELFAHKVDVMNSYCEFKKIKMIHVLQPISFLKKVKSPSEQEYIDWWKKTKRDGHVFTEEHVVKHFLKLRDNFFTQNNNSKYINFINGLDFFDDCEQSIFFDIAHYSNEGYDIVSKKIVDLLIKNL